ncbi:putative glycoside hydrolase [Breznakiella homolactica]|nr:putative glycoside hydrolase [Breznakiella homolactica]
MYRDGFRTASKRNAVLYIALLVFCIAVPGKTAAQTASSAGPWTYLAGTEKGLYGINRYGIPSALWNGGEVRKILKTDSYWALLTDQGILVSQDLRVWEPRNEGLPVKTIKVYETGEKSFIRLVQEIKDLEIHPADPDIMVCAVKDAVFLSRDAGKTWRNLRMPAYRTNGIKAVAAAGMPELTVFLSHSTYGIHYIQPDKPNASWTELNGGLEKLETTNNPDEISDMAAVPGAETGSELYVSQTFRGRVYRLDWETKTFAMIWSDAGDFGTVDSLNAGRDSLTFIRDGSITELDRISLQTKDRQDYSAAIERSAAALGTELTAFYTVPNPLQPRSEGLSFSELWLLRDEDSRLSPRLDLADKKDGLYLPVNHAMDPVSLRPYLEVIEERDLNMVVIDMKDDYGRLRFTPKNPELAKKGRVFWPVDLENLVKTMKDRDIYMVARIVVFKDPELAKKEGGKFAVWDAAVNQPWAGYYETRRPVPDPSAEPEQPGPLLREIRPDPADPAYEIVRTYYDERWVDPYSEEVWEYTAALAQELCERGFDEIQFDYIRFPTDGINLGSAQYRWRDPGMDMESAMLSFLRHVRSRIDAPISIDIYGANGWYRTGARTGQEVELLAPYVDVICPMYYPSHFEQDFLAQSPPELRPYRIYYQGTQRTDRIARGRVIVRPYVQAFFLNVSYDRQYYNLDYVRRQVEGVRDAGNPGITYWNNSGRYGDIPFPGDFDSTGTKTPASQR